MAWEPKQGEIVNYDCYYNNGVSSFTGLFVSAYKDKYIVDDGGGFYAADVIKPMFIEKEPEITVGSVWERFDDLYVVCSVGDGMIKTACNGVTYNTKLEFFKDLHTPRPDKIGMAPCLRKIEINRHNKPYHSYEWCISDQVFRCREDAGIYCESQSFIWPANNSMWVIVDKD